jgi:electron transport complex protein RnfA
MIANLIVIAIGAILINNFVFSRFLGICPYLGVSKRLDTAMGMGLAVIFVMTLASAVSWIAWQFLLQPTKSNLLYIILRSLNFSVRPEMFDLRYLETITFILVIASLVQFVEMVIQRTSPALYNALGIYLPLITTNCAVLGVAELNTITYNYNFIQSTVFGFSGGVGFALALLLMAGIRERLELVPFPKAFKGLPMGFLMAALMSLAFMGFTGLSFVKG